MKSATVMGSGNWEMIVIAAPHARCQDVDGVRSPCDRAAGNAALSIAQSLPSALLLWPKLTRRECDLNRRPARQTAYRSALRRVAGRARLVLDVHSFGRGRIGKLAGNRPFVLLDLCLGGQLSSATRSLRAALIGRGWPTDVICSRLGDIRAEMVDLGIPVVSIEVNSALPAPRRLSLCHHIARWAATYTVC
jgi:hypothetical protein